MKKIKLSAFEKGLIEVAITDAPQGVGIKDLVMIRETQKIIDEKLPKPVKGSCLELVDNASPEEKEKHEAKVKEVEEQYKIDWEQYKKVEVEIEIDDNRFLLIKQKLSGFKRLLARDPDVADKSIALCKKFGII